MAVLHDRIIEDQIMSRLTEMWAASGITKKCIAYKMGVSTMTLWQWGSGGLAFPHSLGRLRRLVGVNGSKLKIIITAPDGKETTF